MRLFFEGATIVNPGSTMEDGWILVDDGRFQAVERGNGPSTAGEAVSLDARNWLLFPGLINIHDHLRGSWLPRCGNGPYENVYEWLRELHVEKAFEPARERDRISLKHLYRLGAYKNLFSGVTTVVDHYFRLDPAIYSDLPIRLIWDFGREGVVRTYHDPKTHPPWGEGIVEEYKQSAGKRPFIIHVEEGFDEETGTELRRLERLGVLGPDTILIHGIGFDEEDIQIVKRRGCHMVWCPATHEFLYGRTGNIPRWLEENLSISLGTDSSLTGGLNMLEEMRTARRVFRQTFGRSLGLAELFEMVTSNPARALMMANEIGRIDAGYAADLLVLERRPDLEPLEALEQARPEDIVLVLQNGFARYADERLSGLFDSKAAPGGSTVVSVEGKRKRIVGDPAGLLREVWEEIGRRFHPVFLPFEDSPPAPE